MVTFAVWWIECDGCGRRTNSYARSSRAAALIACRNAGWRFSMTVNDPDGFAECPQCVARIAAKHSASQPSLRPTETGETA